ncbi:MAG: DUF1330 domain-containing protein [Alphaproteobacteria bacterium]|nr:DUF1330 domain-containing protein [Alphaproteobacteria bacterium]
MLAYWIGRVNVTNPDGYAKYAALAGPAIQKHGGKFLARGGKTETLEGTSYARNVLVEFESLEKAVACYNSPEYAEALKHAKPSATRDIIVVEGV